MKFILPLLFLLSASIACAETTAELLDQLKNAAKAEMRTPLDAKKPAEQQRLQQLRQSIAQLGQAESGDDAGANVLHALEILEILTTSDKVAELSHTLVRQLRDEQKKKDAALIAEMQQGFTAATQAALNAKTVRDLDAPMAAVARLAQKTNSNSNCSANPKVRLLAEQGQQLSQFLRRWQDYLANRESDDPETRRMRVQMLRSGGDFPEFIARSKFLDRLLELEKDRKTKEAPAESKPQESTKVSADAATEEAAKIVDGAHDLKDVGEAIRKLDVMAASLEQGPARNEFSFALRVLNTIQRHYLELEQGQPTSIHVADISEDTGSKLEIPLSRLRLQLRLFALPRALGLGEDGAARLGENSVNYLHRIAATARDKKDWALLGRIVELAQTLKIEIGTFGNDRTALQSFLAGTNQERAAQYALAVGSFEAALKTSSQIVPPETIGEHLEAIRKEHPQEYEQGVQNTLTPPRIPDPRFMDPRFRMPNFPGNPYPQQPVPPSAPTISIPAATPRTSPAPGAQPGGTTDATKAQ
jgi:hypothetical protein